MGGPQPLSASPPQRTPLAVFGSTEIPDHRTVVVSDATSFETNRAVGFRGFRWVSEGFHGGFRGGFGRHRPCSAPIFRVCLQPVYKKETLSCDQPLRRSRSAPDLSEWPVLRCRVPVPAAAAAAVDDEEEDEESVRLRFEKHRMKRRRALSQNKMRSLLRRTKATSEIDLAHIDKEATFGADIASYEILSRVVDALETAVPNQPAAEAHQDVGSVSACRCR